METLIQTRHVICQIKSINSIWENIDPEKKIQYFWLGRKPYHPIWELQKQLHTKRVAGEIPDVVLMLEHEHVYTFGKNSDKNHLLDSKPQNAEVVQIDRGGEVTYHGPGQLVCYPIIDLHNYQMSISWYMRNLENVIIQCLLNHGIKAGQKSGLTGVWVCDEKICAMGVRLSRWVTMHGFALNVNPDMRYFDGMIPCGIFEYGITSLNALGIEVSMQSLAGEIIKNFNKIFFESEV
jgi:lipoate-protein ligase B